MIKVILVNGLPGLLWGLSRKESDCNAADTGSISGSKRSPGRGHGTHSSMSAGKIPRTEEPGRLCLWGCKELDMSKVTGQQQGPSWWRREESTCQPGGRRSEPWSWRTPTLRSNSARASQLLTLGPSSQALTRGDCALQREEPLQ